jgi:DNA-binding LacI/PurR family transcriptional regulator
MNRKSNRTTILDVARELGVSHTTVSRVLNGDSRISKKTAERVLEAAKRLNYRPNIMARALAKKGNRLIGLVLRHIQGSFFSDIIAGVQEEFESRGYSLILCNSDMNASDERNHLRVLIDKQVEGILITPITTEGVNRTAYRQVLDLQVPLVMIGNPKDGVPAPFVKVDNTLGGYLAGKHLVELGHRTLAYIGPDVKELEAHRRTLHSENVERYEGFRQVLLEHGLRDRFSLIEAPMEMVTDRQVDEVLALQPCPTALFCYSDMMAIKTMRLLEARGYNVPGDFSIVGYDDLDVASMVNPSLTTLAQPKKDLGRLSALKLMELLEDKTPEAEILQPELRIRRSTAAARNS